MPTPRYLSPLRYPGGKSTMAPYLAVTLDTQASHLDMSVLIEPFGGGLGAGLHLLHAAAAPQGIPPMPRSITEWVNPPACIYQAVG